MSIVDKEKKYLESIKDVKSNISKSSIKQHAGFEYSPLSGLKEYEGDSVKIKENPQVDDLFAKSLHLYFDMRDDDEETAQQILKAAMSMVTRTKR